MRHHRMPTTVLGLLAATALVSCVGIIYYRRICKQEQLTESDE